ncbi:TRAP transporter small permease [Plastoroseomonas arctica]|uniref:TRAP transporter small permease protein n=1 Tax=Plastoroseomonas arctica TaxID=1509237 RepID=A0AAF1KP45_9PROT|nr:TRAP transporter small permease [Plastoroseomonas arctica]MBR0655393.1 TRAP transporter small permease [Plastoroseomonas arctica]
MRRALDALYALSAGLAAASLFGIFAVMMIQIALRQFEVQFSGSDDLSAYLCVGTTFLGLAATFKRGELIRVGMFLEKLPTGARRWAELFALALGIAVMGYITWWTAQDVLFSHEIEEVAQGTVPFPLWIPKLVMPVGGGLLLIAVIDEFISVLMGHEPEYVRAAAERAARGDFSAEV